MPRNYGNHSSNRDNCWVVPTLATAAIAVTTAAVGSFLYQNVPEYGWNGTLRLLWEGDAYDSDTRNKVDCLEQAEIDRSLQESRVHSMESALDLARLNTVDGADSSVILQKWIQYFAAESRMSLDRTLADVSDKLDKIAAKIDGIILQDNENDMTRRIKQRKKLLSKSIVLDMERCDVLLGSYQVLKEQQN
ncbi:MAG: hypothetical protein SGILL_003713 [Bacillariaceae sp.]